MRDNGKLWGSKSGALCGGGAVGLGARWLLLSSYKSQSAKSFAAGHAGAVAGPCVAAQLARLWAITRSRSWSMIEMADSARQENGPVASSSLAASDMHGCLPVHQKIMVA